MSPSISPPTMVLTIHTKRYKIYLIPHSYRNGNQNPFSGFCLFNLYLQFTFAIVFLDLSFHSSEVLIKKLKRYIRTKIDSGSSSYCEIDNGTIVLRF
jgi:hypothetical protein